MMKVRRDCVGSRHLLDLAKTIQWKTYQFYFTVFLYLMTSSEFSYYRKRLNKTQKSLAILLGVSLKAVQSYEQGWRSVPLHIERKLFFLLVNRRRESSVKRQECWTLKKCTCKKECPAWEFQAGHLCWFLNGTLCVCTAGQEGKEKMDICRTCEVLTSQL